MRDGGGHRDIVDPGDRGELNGSTIGGRDQQIGERRAVAQRCRTRHLDRDQAAIRLEDVANLVALAPRPDLFGDIRRAEAVRRERDRIRPDAQLGDIDLRLDGDAAHALQVCDLFSERRRQAAQRLQLGPDDLDDDRRGLAAEDLVDPLAQKALDREADARHARELRPQRRHLGFEVIAADDDVELQPIDRKRILAQLGTSRASRDVGRRLGSDERVEPRGNANGLLERCSRCGVDMHDHRLLVKIWKEAAAEERDRDRCADREREGHADDDSRMLDHAPQDPPVAGGHG